jgi:hypothetical protein
MGTDQGLTEHVVMSPCTFHDDACAAKIKRTRKAGAFGERSRKEATEAMNDGEHERGSP